MSIEDAVRQGDRTAWLAALFAPEPARPALHALAAYRVELGRIVETVRDPMAAEIRLQWWRDAIRDEGFGAGRSVPLVDALREGARRYEWPLDTLCAVSEAFIHDLYADPLPDWDAFDGYAGEACAAPVQLAAMTLCVEALGKPAGLAAARTAATAAGYAGVALAAADVALTVPRRFARGSSLIPVAAWRAATGEDQAASMAAGRLPEGADRAARAVAAHGRAADEAMRRHLAAVAPQARAAFLPAMTARRALATRAPLSERRPASWRTQLDLWWAAKRLDRLD
ncbi:squalene/phytoene synthase family protein [Acuticoccus sp. I52.16.1]|uniref:squalene/phytoene synthase family protein n=1 Tax=Acuticoccus sp. I52.16.1 TaxID=2928472 RepID=UPI001FD111D9|nr:squalene/phytoene synthase family protein [Acuticoccus sp. I52.16.1]UOM34443.1 squalene/phytoene synthase family protein [Acuticoccus sp. I52.16.1]